MSAGQSMRARFVGAARRRPPARRPATPSDAPWRLRAAAGRGHPPRMPHVPFHLRAQAHAARALLKLPRPVLVRLSGGRSVERDGCVLDEQLQFMLSMAERLGRGISDPTLPLAERRRGMDLDAVVFAPTPPPLAEVRDERVSERVRVRIYRPHGVARPAPALVYLHGGGFVLGGLESHDPVCRALAHDAGCVVVSVDYRLAPEHPYPAAADDATEAFRWVVAEAARLGVDPARVAVGGDSAGGNLAAVVALDTRDDEHPPCLQALIYPAVDQTMSFPSLKIMERGFLLDLATIQWFRAQYAPDPADWTKPRASPWFADVKSVAPALVQTAGFDPLRDEGEGYATKLRDGGVAVTARRYRSMVHGYISITGSIVGAREPWDDLVAGLRRAFR